MYKATYKDVKDLIKWGNDHSEIKKMVAKSLQPIGHTVAYYAPSQANWSYQIGIYNVDGTTYELVTRFGSVEGGREIYQTENTILG